MPFAVNRAFEVGAISLSGRREPHAQGREPVSRSPRQRWSGFGHRQESVPSSRSGRVSLTGAGHLVAGQRLCFALWPDPRLRDMGRLLRAIGQALEGLEDMAPGPVAADIDWDREPLREEILVSDDGTPP